MFNKVNTTVNQVHIMMYNVRIVVYQVCMMVNKESITIDRVYGMNKK